MRIIVEKDGEALISSEEILNPNVDLFLIKAPYKVRHFSGLLQIMKLGYFQTIYGSTRLLKKDGWIVL